MWIRTIVALLLAGLLAGCQPGAPGAGGGAPQVVNVTVDSVTVEVRESMPPQVEAKIQGTVGDACTKLQGATQSRSGTTISVQVTAVRQADGVCAQLAQTFELNVPLRGDFPPGDYSVTVNGVSSKFKV